MRGRRLGRRAVVLVVVLALAAAGCGDSGSDEGAPENPEDRTDITVASDTEPAPGGQLVFGLAAETDGWDPTSNVWGGSAENVANAIFDRLMVYDEEAQPVPYLAQSLESNEDFTEWTLTLREGVEFHDGTPVDASAVKQHVEALQSSILTGAATAPIESVEVTSEYVLTIGMNTPWSAFPHVLTFQAGYVAAPSMLNAEDGSRNPVGSGPFVFESWTPDSNLLVDRNENYWREGFPLLESIEFRVLSDVESRTTALEGGDVDLIESTDPGQILDFEAKARDGEYQIFVDPAGETSEVFVGLNTATAPFDNPLARQAVAHALDREAISTTVYEGLFLPATGPFKEDSPWYTETDYPAYDPERARELAEEYQAETGEALSFSLNVTPDPQVVQVAELGQQQLAEVGIDMQINRLETAQLLLAALGGTYEATGFIWFGNQHPDADSIFLRGDLAGDIGQPALNFTRNVNPTIDEALDAARATDDEAEQIEQYRIVQEQMAQDLAFLFITHFESAAVAQNSVRDVVTWETPDGVPGLGQEGSVLMTYQIWIE